MSIDLENEDFYEENEVKCPHCGGEGCDECGSEFENLFDDDSYYDDSEDEDEEEDEDIYYENFEDEDEE